eukprot:12920874-Prorocentrum_lima.AAC.1
MRRLQQEQAPWKRVSGRQSSSPKANRQSPCIQSGMGKTDEGTLFGPTIFTSNWLCCPFGSKQKQQHD